MKNEILILDRHSFPSSLRITTLMDEPVGESFGRPPFTSVGSGMFGVGVIYGGTRLNPSGYSSNYYFGYSSEEAAASAGEQLAQRELDREGAWSYYRTGELKYTPDYPGDPLFIILSKAVGFTLGEIVDEG